MMRGAKDNGKVISPMFPRLHVNDTEKGGPRAPPRNKMALYEQLSVPSQRYSSGSASMLPLPPNNCSNLVPSMSSSHGNGYERSIITPFCNSRAPSHLGEKLFYFSSSGAKLSTVMASQERKSMNVTNDQSLNTRGQLSGKCNLLQSGNVSNFKACLWKKLGEESDYRVLSSTQSEATVHCIRSQHNKDQENQPSLNLSISMQFGASEKQNKGAGAIDLSARDCMRNQNEETAKVSQTCQNHFERSASVSSIRDRTSSGVASFPSSKVKVSETLRRAHPPSNNNPRNSSLDASKGFHNGNTRLNQEFELRQEKIVLRDNLVLELTRGTDKDSASKVRNESHFIASVGDDNRSCNGVENGKCGDYKKCGSLKTGNVERHENVTATSMLDSMSALLITPDDVVKVIGEKQFWRARRAISNQQRLFARQVFELHRLIKVQKLIAESPDLLLEDNLYIAKASLKVSPVKKLTSEHPLDQPSLILKPRDQSQNPFPSIGFDNENIVGKLPLPSFNNETDTGFLTHQSMQSSHSGSTPAVHVAANTKPTPWCFPPPGNQWLVPVMSPSEGLVFKPYTGPCPPTTGFMTPFYGSCGPVNLNSGAGDFLNTAYGVPASHQQGIGIVPSTPPLAPTYFPPYGMPVANHSFSGSAIEQMIPFAGQQSKENQISVGDVNFTFLHQSSFNMPSQMSGVISCRVGKFQGSKESEVQGSTASSPSERPEGDALPLFPTEPTIQAFDQTAQNNKQHTGVFPTEPTIQSSNQTAQNNKQHTGVIKVVPYNARSATESAARIFQSIQDERKHYD